MSWHSLCFFLSIYSLVLLWRGCYVYACLHCQWSVYFLRAIARRSHILVWYIFFLNNSLFFSLLYSAVSIGCHWPDAEKLTTYVHVKSQKHWGSNELHRRTFQLIFQASASLTHNHNILHCFSFVFLIRERCHFRLMIRIAISIHFNIMMNILLLYTISTTEKNPSHHGRKSFIFLAILFNPQYFADWIFFVYKAYTLYVIHRILRWFSVRNYVGLLCANINCI